MNSSSSSPAVICSLPYARSNETFGNRCDCNGGYSGDDCQTVLGWWIPVQWIFYAVFLAVMGLFMFWAWAKLIHAAFLQDKKNSKKNAPDRRINLSVISIILNVIGGTLRFALKAIVQAPVTMSYATPEPLSIQYSVIVLNAVSIACYIASLALIMGFWVEALYAKMNVRMATRTKIVCVIGALFTLLMIPGMIMATLFHQFVVGVFIILIPYLVNTILFNIVVSMLRCRCCVCHPKKLRAHSHITLSKDNKEKIQYVLHYMTIAAISWIFITVLGAFGGIIKPMPHMDAFSFWLVVLSIIAEYVGIWATMMLLERNLGPWKVFSDVVTWNKNSKSPFQTSSSANNTNTNTSLSGSGAITTMHTVSSEETFTIPTPPTARGDD